MMSAIMTEAQFRSMFPKASKSFLDANPLSSPSDDNQTRKPLPVGAAKAKRRGLMNATEREFAMILQSQKQQGEILRYEFEGITLRWSGLAYTPDFVAFHRAYIRLIEVKGNYISGKFERAVERFRHAKTYYGDQFLFELWQKTRAEGWKRLL